MAVLIGFLPLRLASAMQPVRLYRRRNKLTAVRVVWMPSSCISFVIFTIDIPDAFNETILFLAYDESFPWRSVYETNVLFTKDAKLRHRPFVAERIPKFYFQMTTVDTNACRTSPGRVSNASGPRAAGVPPAHDPHPERVSTAFRPRFVLSYL